MTFSQYAGIAIVPTLARLVLGTAFLLFGYMKVFTESEFNTAEAQRLKNVGIEPALKSSPSARSEPSHSFMLASYRQASQTQETESAPAAQDPASTSPPTTPPTNPPAQTPDSTAPAPSPAAPNTQSDAAATQRDGLSPTDPMNPQPLPEGTYTARSVHQITLMLMSKQWPYPPYFAWSAALTELIGGGLILIGLFSRLAGLALAGVMGVAFYLTSLPALMSTSIFELPQQQVSSLYLQLAFFVLAFGVMLTGAGPLSFDRVLFARTVRETEVEVRRKLD